MISDLKPNQAPVVATLRGNIDVFVGGSIEHASERRFLKRLTSDLTDTGTTAVILANAIVKASTGTQQVDFIVATDIAAAVIEVKGYARPVRGGENGLWEEKAGTGDSWLPLEGQNPYRQCLDARFAVSDALRTFGISAEGGGPPYLALHGILCCYPSLAHGSDVSEGDQKVSIGGYDLVKTMLRSPTPAPPWNLNMWRALALKLNLRSINDRVPPEEQAEIAAYLHLFRDLVRRDLGPYVPLPLRGNDSVLTLTNLVEEIAGGTNLFVRGPSGSGKSHLLAHLSLTLSENGMVPIAMRAADFQGRLGPLLVETIAAVTLLSPAALLKACGKTGLMPVVLVDAVNECPPHLADKLIRSLQALRIRHLCPIILSSQQEVPLPPTLAGLNISLEPPDADMKHMLVAAHTGQEKVSLTFSAAEIVSTAHDAMVLAKVLGDEGATASRYALYQSYARAKLGPHPDSAIAFRALGQIAAQMRDRFAFSLPLPEFHRLLAKASSRIAHEGRIYEIAVRSGLLDVIGTRASFKHELLQLFFAAENLLLRAENEEELGSLLARPINRELAELTLGSLSSSLHIDAALNALTSVDQLADALAGRCGAAVRHTILDRANSALVTLARRYKELEIRYEEDDKGKGRFLPVAVLADHTRKLSRQDQAYLRFGSLATQDGTLFQGMLSALAVVDSAIEREIAALRSRHPDKKIAWRSAVFSIVYVTPFGSDLRELSTLLQNCRMSCFKARDDISYSQVAVALEGAETLRYGQLYFLLENCHPLRALTETSYDINKIALIGWRSGIYHLRLATAQFIERHARFLSDQSRQELGEIAQTWLSDRNYLLNSIVLDVLKALDALGDALTIDDVRRERDLILAGKAYENANDLAYAFYTSTYDHPYDSLYSEAFNEMAPSDRDRLLLLALNVSERDSMFFSFLVGDIARNPFPEAAPKLQELARLPRSETPSLQESVSCFANALKALAELDVPLVPAAEPAEAAEHGWYLAANVLHLLYQPDLSRDEYAIRARADWQRMAALHPASLDVIIRIVRDRWNIYDPEQSKFLDWSSEFILPICRRTLEAERDEPVSLFSRHYYSKGARSEQVDFCIQVMGVYGDRSDRPAVLKFLADTVHGFAAVEAARKIESRLSTDS